jgi:proteic killer suppression protein
MKTTTRAAFSRNTSSGSAIFSRGVVTDMDMPGFRLHPLKGESEGFLAVTVRANWRVVFRFVAPDAFDVDYTDYH